MLWFGCWGVILGKLFLHDSDTVLNSNTSPPPKYQSQLKSSKKLLPPQTVTQVPL